MPDWTLVFNDDLTFSSRTEEVILESLTSPEFVYEAAYNSPMIRVGTLNHSELLPELGWTNIDRYPVLRGKKFVELSPGINETYKLSFVPNVDPYFVLILTLKIWVPTMPLSRAGTVSLAVPKSTNATSSVVDASTDLTVLLTANPNRKGASILNSSTASLSLKLAAIGDPASAAEVLATEAVTVTLGPLDYYEVPYAYTGLIGGVWEAENGAAFVTEFV
jgi:hypothetical protein